MASQCCSCWRSFFHMRWNVSVYDWPWFKCAMQPPNCLGLQLVTINNKGHQWGLQRRCVAIGCYVGLLSNEIRRQTEQAFLSSEPVYPIYPCWHAPFPYCGITGITSVMQQAVRSYWLCPSPCNGVKYVGLPYLHTTRG